MEPLRRLEPRRSRVLALGAGARGSARAAATGSGARRRASSRGAGRSPLAVVGALSWRSRCSTPSRGWAAREAGAGADAVARYAPRIARRPRSSRSTSARRSYSAPLAERRVLRRRPAAPSRPPPARHRHPRPRRPAPDAQGRARRAADRRLHEPDRDPARAAVRRARRLLRPAHRRRRLLRHLDAGLDAGLLLLIALIMALGRGPLQVCVALGVTSWVGFCRVVARRDAEAARARLRRRRRARSGVSEVAHHLAPHPAESDAPGRHHLRADCSRAWCSPRRCCRGSASASTGAGGR